MIYLARVQHSKHCVVKAYKWHKYKLICSHESVPDRCLRISFFSVHLFSFYKSDFVDEQIISKVWPGSNQSLIKVLLLIWNMHLYLYLEFNRTQPSTKFQTTVLTLSIECYWFLSLTYDIWIVLDYDVSRTVFALNIVKGLVTTNASRSDVWTKICNNWRFVILTSVFYMEQIIFLLERLLTCLRSVLWLSYRQSIVICWRCASVSSFPSDFSFVFIFHFIVNKHCITNSFNLRTWFCFKTCLLVLVPFFFCEFI